MKHSELNKTALECIEKVLKSVYVDEPGVDRGYIEVTIDNVLSEAGLSGIGSMIKTCFDKVLKETGLVKEDYWQTVPVPPVGGEAEESQSIARPAGATFLS